MVDKDFKKHDSIKNETGDAEELDSPVEISKLEVRLCSNCNGALTGHFCGTCGQKDTNLLKPFWALMEDTLGDLFAFDSRFFKTLIPLFFRPGHVTKIYNQGKRARFVPPFRQYLVISVIFFLMLSFSDLLFFKANPDGNFNLTFDKEISEETKTSQPQEVKTDKLLEETAPPSEVEIDKLVEAAKNTKGAKETFDLTAKNLLASREKNLAGYSETEKKIYDFAISAVQGASRIASNPALLNKLFSDWVPKAMFLMLPVFALLFKIFYIRRKKFYIEHLIFSLHFHAFIFLLFTFMLLCYVYIPFSHDTLAYFFWYVPLYLFIAQWVVYGQGPIKTFFKSAFISLAYIILMSISLGIALGYGLSRV